jgi:hypothetical protein
MLVVPAPPSKLRVGRVLCQDTPRGYAISFSSGLKLEVFVNTSHAYARWWLADGKLLASATWGHA